MKILWLRKIGSEEFSRKKFLLSIYLDLDNLQFTQTLTILGYMEVSMQMYWWWRKKNPFWKDVVKHYKKLYQRCCPLSSDEFMSECIHYNVNITRDKKIVYIKDWIDNDIVLIRQLLGPHSGYLNLNDFTNQFPHIKTNFWGFMKVLLPLLRSTKRNVTSNFQLGSDAIILKYGL